VKKDERYLLGKMYRVHLRQALKAGLVVLVLTTGVSFAASRAVPKSVYPQYIADLTGALLAAWITLHWNWGLHEEKLVTDKWKKRATVQADRVYLSLNVLENLSNEAAQDNPTFLDSQSAKVTLRRHIREIRSALGNGIGVVDGIKMPAREEHAATATAA